MLILLLSTAHAAPTFKGAPEDVAFAARVWDSARTCTGRDGVAHATVEIRRDLDESGGGIGGAAMWDAKGLYAIQLTPDTPTVLLAHEVGHAWFQGFGALGPIEGRTELLAECVARAHPEVVPYLYDAQDVLDDMPELTTWTVAAQKSMSPEQINAAYAGSLRFFLAAGEVVPVQKLFDSAPMGWDRVRSLLASDPRGAPLVKALDGGAEAERNALADPDGDGVATVAETIRGTDPDKWDTDGDGWWDGAPSPIPLGALPVPHDGTPICPPKLAEEGSARIIVGGSLRGFDLGAYASTLSGENNYLRFAQELNDRPGGYWYRVIGNSLADNPRCRVTVGLSLRAVDDDAPLAEIDPLAAALTAADQKATGLVPRRYRLLVDVNGSGVHRGRFRQFDEATVGVDALRWASRKPEIRMPVLAATIVAELRIPYGDAPAAERNALVVAMVRALCGDEEQVPGPLVTKGQIVAAQKRVDAAGGWAPFLAQ